MISQPEKIYALEFRNITFSYDNNGINALENVNFKIESGSYNCIVGHNGSGKSTISKIAFLLLKPQSGDIFIKNTKVTVNNLLFLRDHLGIIFQNPDNQFIGITTEDDIAFGLENHKVPTDKMNPIIKNASKIIDITDLLEKESSNLSGGQKQKVAITSILALSPDIIFFDESTSMLDPEAKLNLKKLMRIIQIEYGKTIISITHDMEELKHADKIIFLSKGKIIADETPQKLLFNRDFLLENSLDVPFTLGLSLLLNEKDNKIKKTLNQEELIRNICQRMK